MFKNKIVRYVINFILCFALYLIPVFILANMGISSNSGEAMGQATMVALLGNHIITVYLKNFITDILKVKSDLIIDDESSIGDKILGVIYSVGATAVLYLLLSNKSIKENIIYNCTLIYLIFSCVIIQIGSARNRKSRIFRYLKEKKKIIKYLLLPLSFSVIWTAVVLVGFYVFKKAGINEMNDKTIAMLVVPHIFAIVLSIIYSKISLNLAIKAGDKNAFKESKTGRIYYEMFFYIFFIFHFLTTLHVRKNVPGISTSESSSLYLTTFLIVGMVEIAMKFFIFDGASLDEGPINGGRPIRNDNAENDKFRFDYSRTYMKDQFGNPEGTIDTYTVGDVTTSTVKDKEGRTKGKLTRMGNYSSYQKYD